jgi:hypothetical protein
MPAGYGTGAYDPRVCGVNNVMEKPMPKYYTAWVSILQVLFSKKSKNIPIFFCFFPLFLPERAQFTMPGKATLLQTRIHQDDIRPDSLDAAPGDLIIVPSAE